MRGFVHNIGWVVVVALVMASCSVTRHIPEGHYMLTRSTVASDKSTPKTERITPDDIETYIQQTPHKHFLGTNLNLWIYSASNPDKNRWWDRTMRKIGTAPVIFDPAKAEKSNEYLSTYIHSRGYFDGYSVYKVDTNARRRVSVGYALTQREPYRIGEIRYDFKDKFLEPVVMRDSAHTVLHTGDPFDSDVLGAERTRIKDYLRNRGYYNFSVNNVRYNAYMGDTAAGNRAIDLQVIVEQFLSDYDKDGKPVMNNNTVYRIGRINVYPDYDPLKAVTDTSYMNHIDTLEHNGLNIVYAHKLRVKESVLRHIIGIYPNYVYSAEDVSRTYNNIMRLGYYKSARIVFTDSPDSTANMVTFIGENSVGEQTTEKYLDCNIYCTPSKRQSYDIGIETTFTSDYYGLKGMLKYGNRSLFRGVEMFDVSFTGSYDFMKAQGVKAAFEFGGATSLTFPRFLLPVKIHSLSKLPNQRTRVELSVTAQRRPYYSRVLSRASWGYSWSGNRFTTYTVKPIDLSVVKMNSIDSIFLKSIKNPYLRDSYESQLVAGISGSWVFNNSGFVGPRRSSVNARLNWETTGNLLSGICSLVGTKAAGKDYYEILGIPFAQYIRADLSIASSVPLGSKSSLAYRIYGGAGYTYGNSTSMPNDRLFYAGGSNSMRGWAARTLGPGTAPRPDYNNPATSYPNQLGNMRLEANLEARFPLWSIFRGAVFLDAGNVWYTGQGDKSSSESVFHIENFYKQLGFNTGMGLRVDISMTVVRLDWGIRLFDPNLPEGQRWTDSFRLNKTALSLAVGYPF